MSNIGYRIKLDNFLESKEKIKEFLDYYYSLFDISELKMTGDIYRSNYFEYIIKKYISRHSLANFHISKDFVYNFSKDSLENQLMDITKNNSVNLVTHLPSKKFDSEFILNLKHISNTIPSKNMLLLENPSTDFDIFLFFEECNKLNKILFDSDIRNIGFCLDFGHLLQMLNEQDINFKIWYNYMTKCKQFYSSIKELHLHDFDGKNDHQVFDENSNNLEFLTMLCSILGKNIPIILETPIENVEETGVKQIKLISRVVNDENKKNR